MATDQKIISTYRLVVRSLPVSFYNNLNDTEFDGMDLDALHDHVRALFESSLSKNNKDKLGTEDITEIVEWTCQHLGESDTPVSSNTLGAYISARFADQYQVELPIVQKSSVATRTVIRNRPGTKELNNLEITPMSVQGGSAGISGSILRDIYGPEIGLNGITDWESPDCVTVMANLWTVVQAVIFQNKKSGSKGLFHIDVKNLKNSHEYSIRGRQVNWRIQVDIATDEQSAISDEEITLARLTAMVAPCLRQWLMTNKSGINVLNSQGLNFMSASDKLLVHMRGDAVSLVCMLRGGTQGFDWEGVHRELVDKVNPSLIFTAMFKTQFLALVSKGTAEATAIATATKQYTKTAKISSIPGVSGIDTAECVEISPFITSVDPKLRETADAVVNQLIQEGTFVRKALSKYAK